MLRESVCEGGGGDGVGGREGRGVPGVCLVDLFYLTD